MKKIRCDVCRSRVVPQRERTVKCRFETTEDTTVHFDVMDCPHCGCEVTLHVRNKEIVE